ncbi:MAG: hypothetical protein AB7H94_24530 [Lautropia sp.]
MTGAEAGFDAVFATAAANDSVGSADGDRIEEESFSTAATPVRSGASPCSGFEQPTTNASDIDTIGSRRARPRAPNACSRTWLGYRDRFAIMVDLQMDVGAR